MTPENLAALETILDVISERREIYCPRCRRVTLWFNSCRDGAHSNFQCPGCHIHEGDRLTDDEWLRHLEHQAAAA